MTDPDNMTEEERIDFIREHGSEQQKAGLRAVLNGNKYKVIRNEMWSTRLKHGKRMVQTILERQSESNHPKKEQPKTSISDFIK